MKCDNCDQFASVHVTKILHKKKSEHHLCEQCAEKAGFRKAGDRPIDELLQEFVAEHSKLLQEKPPEQDRPPE